MQTEHMKVTGMTCGGCTSKVTQALKAVNGVGQVDVSLAGGGEATVQFDEELASAAQLTSAVQKAGYGVNGPKAPSDSGRKGCCG